MTIFAQCCSWVLVVVSWLRSSAFGSSLHSTKNKISTSQLFLRVLLMWCSMQPSHCVTCRVRKSYASADKFEPNLGWVTWSDNRFLRTFVVFVQLPGLPMLQLHGLRESINSGKDPLRLDQPLCCSWKRPPGSGPRFGGGRGQFGSCNVDGSWPQELFKRGDLKMMKSFWASGVGGIGNGLNRFLRNILGFHGILDPFCIACALDPIVVYPFWLFCCICVFHIFLFRKVQQHTCILYNFWTARPFSQS